MNEAEPSYDRSSKVQQLGFKRLKKRTKEEKKNKSK
jgi:hypothetical protein